MGWKKGVIDIAAGTIGGSKRLFKAATKNVDIDILRTFDGFDLDQLKNLPLDDVKRLDANKVMAATKKISKTDRAMKAGGSGFSAAKKTCGKNIGLCAGGGVAAYLTYKSYKDLKKEQKQCLKICMPEDWNEYKDRQKSQPTYKTRDAVSPYDPSVTYAELYPDNEDYICTKQNLLEDGFRMTDRDSCDKFCQNVCDFSLDDVLINAPGVGADVVKTILGDVVGDIFGESGGKIAMIVSGVLSCLILLMVMFKIFF